MYLHCCFKNNFVTNNICTVEHQKSNKFTRIFILTIQPIITTFSLKSKILF